MQKCLTFVQTNVKSFFLVGRSLFQVLASRFELLRTLIDVIIFSSGIFKKVVKESLEKTSNVICIAIVISITMIQL